MCLLGPPKWPHVTYMPHDVYECIWRTWQPWATMDFPATCDDIQPRLIPLSVLDGLSHLHHWVFGVLSRPLLSVCFKLCHLNFDHSGQVFWNRKMYCVYIYVTNKNNVYIYIYTVYVNCVLYVYNINILYETFTTWYSRSMSPGTRGFESPHQFSVKDRLGISTVRVVIYVETILVR